MILSSHMAMGAVIGAKFNNPWLIVVLGVIFHYVLDIIPHDEYDIEDMKAGKVNRGFLLSSFKVLIDLSVGLGVGIYIYSVSGASFLNIILAMFFSLLPDLFTLVSFFYKSKFLTGLNKFHQFLHFYKYRKVPYWIRVSTQILVIIWSVWIV